MRLTDGGLVRLSLCCTPSRLASSRGSLRDNPAGGAALDAIAVAIGNLTNLRKLDLRSFTAAGGADGARRERVRKAAREGATVMF